MIKNLILGLGLLAILFTSCGSDEEPPEMIKIEGNIVVVNQGIFNTGTGTLTLAKRESTAVAQNSFSTVNNGMTLGNVAQSMIQHDGKNYISINNGGKVVVTDDEDFTFLDTIGGIDQGRYFASNGEKLYLTSWGTFGSNGGVYEINTTTDSVEDYIDTGSGPEGIVFADGLLYVAKGGGFGVDSLVLIIDPNDNSIVNSLNVGHNPQLMVKDNDDNVYVICSGINDWMDPTNNTNGSLVKITGQNIAWSIDLPNGSNNLTIDTENEFLYFVSEGEVLKQDLNLTELQTKVIRSLSAYALSFDDVQQRLYMADAKDFNSQGEVFIYSTSDEMVRSFDAGIIPGYFHFQ